MPKYSDSEKKIRQVYSRQRYNVVRKLSRLINRGYNVPESTVQLIPPTLKELGRTPKEKEVKSVKKLLNSPILYKDITYTKIDNITGQKKEISYKERNKEEKSESAKKSAETKKLNKALEKWDWKKDSSDWKNPYYAENEDIKYSDKAEQLFRMIERKLGDLINFISTAKNPKTAEHNTKLVQEIGDILYSAYENINIKHGLAKRLETEELHLQELFNRITTEYREWKDPSSAAHEIYYIITNDYSEVSAKALAEEQNKDNVDNSYDQENEEISEEDFPFWD